MSILVLKFTHYIFIYVGIYYHFYWSCQLFSIYSFLEKISFSIRFWPLPMLDRIRVDLEGSRHMELWRWQYHFYRSRRWKVATILVVVFMYYPGLLQWPYWPYRVLWIFSGSMSVGVAMVAVIVFVFKCTIDFHL